jgi:SpoVK/Ycf46/Vps4 family AAA+-type ATPase
MERLRGSQVKAIYDAAVDSYENNEITQEQMNTTSDLIREHYPEIWQEILLETGGSGMGGGGDTENVCDFPDIQPKDPVSPYEIVGMRDERATLRNEFVIPLVFPRQVRAKNKALLLYGPPGTGKSMLAKALGELMYHELKIQRENRKVTDHLYTKEDRIRFRDAPVVFAPSGAEFQSPYRSCTSKLIKHYFDHARSMAQQHNKYAILFMDEIDGYISSNRGSDDTGSAAVANTLLQILSDSSYSDVIFVAATNFPEKLDSAFQRRFKTRIFVDLPDDQTRRELIAYKLCDLLNYDPEQKNQATSFLECATNHIKEDEKGCQGEDCRKFIEVVNAIATLTGFYYDKLEKEVERLETEEKISLSKWSSKEEMKASFLDRSRTNLLHADMSTGRIESKSKSKSNSNEEVKDEEKEENKEIKYEKYSGKPLGYSSSDINDIMNEVGSLLGRKYLFEKGCLSKAEGAEPNDFSNVILHDTSKVNTCRDEMYKIDFVRENLDMILDEIDARESTVDVKDYYRILKYAKRLGRKQKTATVNSQKTRSWGELLWGDRDKDDGRLY